MLPDKSTELALMVQDLERHHLVTVLVGVIVESNDMLAHSREAVVFIPVIFSKSIGLQLRNGGEHVRRLPNLDKQSVTCAISVEVSF